MEECESISTIYILTKNHMIAAESLCNTRTPIQFLPEHFVTYSCLGTLWMCPIFSLITFFMTMGNCLWKDIMLVITMIALILVPAHCTHRHWESVSQDKKLEYQLWCDTILTHSLGRWTQQTDNKWIWFN